MTKWLQFSERFCLRRLKSCIIHATLHKSENIKGTKNGITQPPPRDGPWSALFSNLSKSALDNYIVKCSERPLLEEVTWSRKLCPIYWSLFWRIRKKSQNKKIFHSCSSTSQDYYDHSCEMTTMIRMLSRDKCHLICS